MPAKPYLIVSGGIFGLVALGHLLRLINQTSAQLGSWTVPMWLSWIGLVVAGFLCVSGLRLGAKR